MKNPHLTRAWAQYKRLLLIMAAITLAAILVGFGWLYATDTPMPLHFIIAISLAIGGSLMLSAALMGLVFFSNASGADDEVIGNDAPPGPKTPPRS